MVYMSKSNFFKAFKLELGISCLDYIIRERLKLAKQFLNNHFNSISEAAYKSGFNNLNYFSEVFKKFEGLTPSINKYNSCVIFKNPQN